MASIASFCPIILLLKFSFNLSNFSVSEVFTLATGIFVQSSITWARLSNVTSSGFIFSFSSSSLVCSLHFSSFNFAAFSKDSIVSSVCSWFSNFSFNSISDSIIAFNFLWTFSSLAKATFSRLTLAQASSSKSIALSGKNLSWMYFFERLTACFKISSDIFTSSI